MYFYTLGEFTIQEIYPEYLKFPNKISIGGYTYLDGTPAVQTECVSNACDATVDTISSNTSSLLKPPS